MFTLIDVLRRKHAPPTHGIYDEVRKDFRVGLTDIDLNLHLNNAKYLRYMDLARLENVLATGIFWKLTEARTRPIIANTEISYIRELRTWQKFSVSAQLVGVDEKYMYYEQRFLSDGKLCTHSFIRMACVHRRKSRPITEVFAILGITEAPPALPEPVLLWKDMLNAKKQYSLGNTKTVVEKQKDVA